MFSISGISVYYPGRELLNNISFIINARDRIGLVGKNGAGKSTLMKLIASMQQADSGTVVIPGGREVGYLPQELVIDSGRSVYDECLSALKEVNELEEEIERLHAEIAHRTDYESEDYLHLFNLINEKHERFHHLDGNKKESRLEKILKGLGFRDNDLYRNMQEFSGGWQMRVELAKIILRNPDLIMLDEPTNHLDIESILWLEDFLINYPGAVVMVSHDRMFLDTICKRTIEIINGKIYDYPLSYSRFMEVREERLESQFAAARNQQRFIEQQERFINRFRAKNTKARQVQSKIRQLEKIEKVEFDEEDYRQIDFRFPPAPRSGTTVVEAKDLSKEYGSLKVLQNVNFHIERGERIAFVGRNGEGKTTLVKMIVGETDFSGMLKTGFNVEIGYYAQVQEQSLDINDTVLQAIESEAKGEWSSISKIRGLLGAFLFTEDDADKKVKVLSGGEKSRLALAKLLLKPANLLILDEPTNHLDIVSKEVLKNALIKYEGTLILVSHDRNFLQGLTQRTFEFRKGGIKEHLGGIDEFLRHHKVESFREFEKESKGNLRQITSHNDDNENKENYLKRKEKEKDIRKAENRIKKLEDQISEQEKKLMDLELIMQGTEFSSDHEYAKAISIQHHQCQLNISVLMEDWECGLKSLEEIKHRQE